MWAVAATALLLATPSFAQTFTYSFAGSNGFSTDLNGSTITIQDNSGVYTVTAYDIIDTGEIGSPFTYNTAGQTMDITSATTSGWVGSFYEFSLNGTILAGIGSSDGLQDNQSSLDVSGLFTSAPGNWSYVTPTVPDASNTFILLLGVLGLTALGARRFCLQPPGLRN